MGPTTIKAHTNEGHLIGLSHHWASWQWWSPGSWTVRVGPWQIDRHVSTRTGRGYYSRHMV